MPSESILPSDIEREKQVREMIIEKAEISHNALLKIVVDEKRLMARKTFAKTVKSLLEKGLIFYRQEKNKKSIFCRTNKWNNWLRGSGSPGFGGRH